MAKTKLLPMQKKSSKGIPKLKLKAGIKLKYYSPTEELANEDLICRAIWECLKNNDPEGVIEVLQAHFEAVNKLKLAKDIAMPRSKIYHLFSTKNPTLKTLAKIIHDAA